MAFLSLSKWWPIPPSTPSLFPAALCSSTPGCSRPGYDPVQLARFFEKLNAQGNSGLQFLSDHPNPDNRERAIEQEALRLPQQVYSYQTGDFQRMKQIAATIKEPASPAPTER